MLSRSFGASRRRAFFYLRQLEQSRPNSSTFPPLFLIIPGEMTYSEILAHIFSRGRFGMKPGLERVSTILSRLGNPQLRVPAVQIAGTNGKGSTGAFLAAIMTAAGYRTAFFSSPHLVNFSERFRIDGGEIPDETLAGAARRVLAVAPPEATFFELVTAIGFLVFADEEVDLAIMEAGMGGRWDATNVVDGILAIITPISFDHREYLGHTLGAIAAEKAGIIKPGRPVVVASQEQEALAVIVAVAAALGAGCRVWDVDFTAAAGAQGVSYQAEEFALDNLESGLKGRFQAVNIAAAITAARLLAGTGFPVDEAAIRSGVASARWPGRMELFPGHPPILLDGAHNRAGAAAVAESLADFSFERLLLVAGVMADKDWQEMLGQLLPHAQTVFAVEPSLERALPAEKLAAFCRQQGVHAVAAGTVRAGLQMAATTAGENDLVLVCGSLFTVGEARAFLTGKDFMPIRG